jgi:hypothetical protein
VIPAFAWLANWQYSALPKISDPGYIRRMHKHLRRLERVWIEWPVYFITTCALNRRPILASKEVAAILAEECRGAHDRHGWAIGRYVIMVDHVHFFCSAELAAKPLPISPKVERMDEQANEPGVAFFRKYLAERIFR